MIGIGSKGFEKGSQQDTENLCDKQSPKFKTIKEAQNYLREEFTEAKILEDIAKKELPITIVTPEGQRAAIMPLINMVQSKLHRFVMTVRVHKAKLHEVAKYLGVTIADVIKIEREGKEMVKNLIEKNNFGKKFKHVGR